MGHIDIDGRKFIVMIQPGHYKLELEDVNFINVAFALLDENGNFSTKTTFANISPSKIIGAVVNAILQYINKHAPDIVLFMAHEQVDKRMRIYNFLAQHLGSSYGTFHTNINIGDGGKATIVFSNNISDNTKAQFEQIIKEKSTIKK